MKERIIFAATALMVLAALAHAQGSVQARRRQQLQEEAVVGGGYGAEQQYEQQQYRQGSRLQQQQRQQKQATVDGGNRSYGASVVGCMIRGGTIHPATDECEDGFSGR
ncbi:MAG: hypothetical protein ACRDYA_23105 [Egibacteraceae bacterium]